MAVGDITVTIVGNLTDDPELRYTPQGAPVTNIRVATTPRRRDTDTGQWVDGEAMFITCTVWNDQAEHVAETLTKGARVIVVGRLRQRSYQTGDGEKRTVVEVVADEVGPALRFATAKVTRIQRRGNTAAAEAGHDGGKQPPF